MQGAHAARRRSAHAATCRCVHGLLTYRACHACMHTSPEQRSSGGRAQHHRRWAELAAACARFHVDRAARPGITYRPEGRASAFEVGTRGGERHQHRKRMVVLVRLEVATGEIDVDGGFVGRECKLRVMHARAGAIRGAVAEEVVYELRLRARGLGLGLGVVIAIPIAPIRVRGHVRAVPRQVRGRAAAVHRTGPGLAPRTTARSACGAWRPPRRPLRSSRCWCATAGQL